VKSLDNYLLKRYVGYVNERDEYQKSKIYQTLANANLLTMYLISLFMLISLGWDAMHQQFTLGTILLFLAQQINSYYILFKMRKYQLAHSEFYDEASYQAAAKGLKRKAVWAGANWGIIMFVMMNFVFPALGKEPIHVTWISVAIYVVTGALFGSTMYALARSQLKLIKEE
jgi:hypothetical protein